MKTDDKIIMGKKKVVESTAESENWKSKYLRALADYQNLEKRKTAEMNEVREHATEYLITRLLPVMDTLLMAEKHLGDPGLTLAIKEFAGVLINEGVAQIETTDRTFNPQEMECIEAVNGLKNQVISEVLPGYRLKGKVIRVAKVKVGTGKN